MKKILFGIGMLVLGLAFTTEAKAHGPRYGPARPYARTYFGARPYHLDNGVRFSGGYYFSGRRHFHFSYRTWSPTFRRYHFYDPYLRAYYYYCPVTARYLPVPVVLR